MKKDALNFNEITRRRFLQIASGMSMLAYLPFDFKEKSDKWGYVLPTRRLGKTGLDVTIFALGGGPSNINHQEEEAILTTAFERGCRFFETARSYGTEPAFGRVLEPYRKEIVLSSKSRATNAETLNRELDESLKALKTDYLDVYLMHNVPNPDVMKQKFEGGVWDAMVKAKREGKVKHLGFSCHANYDICNQMFDLNLPDLEVVLMPVNVIDNVNNSFVINSLPKAVEKNIGIMAMKPLGGGGMLGTDITWGTGRGNKRPRVIPDLISMEEAQHFVYSHPVSAVSFGCTSVEQVVENISFAKSYRRMNSAKQASLIESVSDVAKNNLLEHYKGNS
jgi:predicted aldo/keto reductase-like oxidoreductase